MERNPIEPSQLSHQKDQPIEVLILAAGLGTRMKSARAKVLHEIGGLPLLAYVCRTAQALNPRNINVIVGHQAADVEKAARDVVGDSAKVVTQTEQKGTGDAVMSARDILAASDSVVVVLSGDVPLLKP